MGLTFANQADEEELRRMLREFSMDLYGDIQDHLVLKENNIIIAGLRLLPAGAGMFHIPALVVREEARRAGTGRRVLGEICADPWRYCHDAPKTGDPVFRITVMSRGDAVPFYKKCGFRTCAASTLPDPFDYLCGECPDVRECRPVAMEYKSKLPGN